MSIGVLGAGAFGTALAIALANAGKPVVLWCRDGGQAQAMQAGRENAPHLPGLSLPQGIGVTADTADLKGCDVLLACVPAQQTAVMLAALAPSLPKVPLVLCAKGLEKGTSRLQSDIAAQALPGRVTGVLTGPGFAREIASGLPTALTFACAGTQAEGLQHLLSTPRMRLYLTDDLRGAQIGGAAKNVIALACGMSVGAGLGESARAALMTRGFAELARLALALGGRAETLTGLSGLGDLALTCTSVQSRNFAAGLALGRGGAVDASATVEGLATARAAFDLAQKLGVRMPIAGVVAEVVEGRATIAQAMELLLTRPLRAEQEDR